MRKREAFQEMLRLARAGEIDLVRAEAVDRANRNEFDRRVVERELAKYNVELLYIGEIADLPPEQLALNRGLRGTVAEFESLQTSQRVYSRMRYRAEQGKWRGGRPNYGLQPDGNGWFVPDPVTFPVLLHILSRIAEGWGRYRVCKELNQGISINGEPPRIPPTPYQLEYAQRPHIERMDPETGDIVYEPKPEPSPYWGTSTIALLFKEAVDGVYAGIYRWGGDYTGRKLNRDRSGKPKEPVVYQHEPFLPAELISKLRRIKEELPARTGGRVSTYLVKPTCALCGGPMHGNSYVHKGRIRRYYICGNGRNKAGSCRYWSALADMVEDEVLGRVVDSYNTIDPHELQRQMEQAAAEEIARLEDIIEELRLRVEEGQRLKDDQLRYLVTFGSTLGAELRRELENQVNGAIRELEQRQLELDAVVEGLREEREKPLLLDLSAIDTVREALLNREHVGYDPLHRALTLLVKEVRLSPAEGRARQKRANAVKIEVTLRPADEALRRG